jgi:hypothetical protein
MENTDGDQPAEWADAEEEEETSVKCPERTEKTQEDAETFESPTVTVAVEDGTATPYSSLTERAERKREREKKRRFDLNEAFDRLKELIFTINPEIRKEAEQRMAASKAKNEEQGVFNRLELVLYAINTLEVVYEENEERKMVIQHMARGMLAGKRGAGLGPEAPPVAPTLPNPAASSFPPPNIQREEAEQRLKLEAALAGAAARPPPAGFSSHNQEALLLLARQQAASLNRPPHPPLSVDSSFGARNPHAAAAAHLLGHPSLPPLAGDLGRQGAFGQDALYRAHLNRILQEEGEKQSFYAAASNLSSGFPPLGPMRNAGADSLRQAMFREQAIAAAARAQQGGVGVPPELDPYAGAKRMRNF